MPSAKVVVVTGASAGVGRAVARAFARRGAHLALLARGRDGLDAACAEVEAAGGRALPLVTDVADPEQVEDAAACVERRLGPIDVWVNDAMTTVFSPVHRLTADEFRRVTDVTYLGTVYGTMAALSRMRPRNRGVIVQVGSALCYRSIPLQSAYCGAKSAVRGFTDSLRSELHHDRCRVKLTMVHLPAINTPQFETTRIHMDRHPQPVPPIYQPEIAAEAIVSAARRPRREVWVGLPTIKAILGQRFIPGLLDRYLARAAYDGQLLDEPADPNRPDNLFSPLPGDHGAHGRFDDRAKVRSLQMWVNTRRGRIVAGVALAGLAGAALSRRLEAR
jgi:NAD(P)-dependent dehydrogenase (short-subunit alcohol dehydrogenase family)